MFGKNKISQEEIDKLKKILEIDERFFTETAGKKDMFDATVTEITESYRQVDADVAQLRENLRSSGELASGNLEVEAKLSRQINDCRENAKRYWEKQSGVTEEFHEISDKLIKLVDENKHFTSPSKYLSKFSAGLKAQNDAAHKSLDRMEEYGKQMGVLALNAAIEAGRLGEAGMQFVTAAEAIRVCASNYDGVIADARSQLEESDKRINELEEQVRRLVAQLKENNISTAKLMKLSNEVVKHADALDKEKNLEEWNQVYNQITILRNADEEMIKSSERNRMQLDDLMEEFATQQKNQKELLQMADPLYRHIIERKAGQ